MTDQTESYGRFEQNHLTNIHIKKKVCCSWWKPDQINTLSYISFYKMILNILNILKTFSKSLESRKDF